MTTNLISKGPSCVTITRFYWCSQHVEFNLICLKQLTFRLISKGRIGMLEQIISCLNSMWGSGSRKESIERLFKSYGWLLGILCQHFALVCLTYLGRFAPSGLLFYQAWSKDYCTVDYLKQLFSSHLIRWLQWKKSILFYSLLPSRMVFHYVHGHWTYLDALRNLIIGPIFLW